jgi:hypothetical protein
VWGRKALSRSSRGKHLKQSLALLCHEAARAQWINGLAQGDTSAKYPIFLEFSHHLAE